MAFIPHQFDTGFDRAFEMLPATGSLALKVGTALTVTSGKLALATGTVKPSYISMQDATTTDGQLISVQRVDSGVTYETELSVASADIAVGGKYTIDTTGGKLTATATGGIAEVVSFDGKAAGDTVRVRF